MQCGLRGDSFCERIWEMIETIRDKGFMAEPCGDIDLRTVRARILFLGRSGPGGRACVNGDGTIVRSRNPSAGHIRRNNGSHEYFAPGSIRRRFP